MQQTKETESDLEIDSGFIHNKNIKIFYKRYNPKENGHPIVLISGLSRDHRHWKDVAPALAMNGYRVIVYDNRGIGQSFSPEPPYKTQDMVEDLDILFQELKIEKAHIVGHSMGGFIAQSFSALYPDRVDCLFLYSTLASVKDNVEGITYLRKLRHPRDCGSEEYQTKDGFMGQVSICKKHNNTKIIPQIKAKTLVLYGEEEAVCSEKTNEAMVSLFIERPLIRSLPGGHSAHETSPQLFANVIQEWIDKNSLSN